MLELLQQFIRFVGAGLTSAIGHYTLLILLTQFAAVDAVVASSAGAALGAVINYSMNYRFTFRSSKRHRESMSKFVVVASIGLLLNACFMWIGVHLLDVYYLISQIITTGLVLLWSFFGNRYWTFYHRPERE
jgi:putative flippase GtrA